MRGICTVLLAIGLFASAIAKPNFRSQDRIRKTRSLVFTGEPNNEYNDQNYNDFLERSETDHEPLDPFPRGGVDDRVKMTSDVDGYDYPIFDTEKEFVSEESEADDQDDDIMKRPIDERKRIDFEMGNSIGQDEEDDVDDQDYLRDRVQPGNDESSYHKMIATLKKFLHGSGKDLEKLDDQESNEREKFDESFGKNWNDRPVDRSSLVPKFDDWYKPSFDGQGEDFDTKTNDIPDEFDSDRDLDQKTHDDSDATGQFHDSDESDDSDEFHESDDSDQFYDSNEFEDSNEFPDSKEFEDSDEAEDRDQFDFDGETKNEIDNEIPDQEVDNDLSIDNRKKSSSPQEPDGRGVIQPRFGGSRRFIDNRSFDFAPEVQRWKRNAWPLRSRLCDEICNPRRNRGRPSPRSSLHCKCTPRHLK